MLICVCFQVYQTVFIRPTGFRLDFICATVVRHVYVYHLPILHSHTTFAPIYFLFV